MDDFLCEVQSDEMVDDRIPVDSSLDWLDDLKANCDGSVIAAHIAKGIVTVDYGRMNADDVVADIATQWPYASDSASDASDASDSASDSASDASDYESIDRFTPYVTDELERSALFLRMLWGFHRTGYWANAETFETKFCRKG